MTLMTAREVIESSPVKETFPDLYVCDQLSLRERETFRRYLTMELYDQMLNDLVTYEGSEPYSLSTTYQTGDIVIYEASYYVSLKDDNKKTPDNISFWRKADKFNAECYNKLWCRGLKTFLAFRIILPALRYATYQAGAKGVVIHMEHGETHEKTADHRAFEQYLRQIESDSEIMLSDIMDYMKNGDCSKFIGIFEDECINTDRHKIGLKRILMK